MTREELIDKICPACDIYDCNNECCEDCNELLNEWLDKYNKQIKEEAIDKYRELLKNYFVIPHDLRVIDMYAKQLKEQNK